MNNTRTQTFDRTEKGNRKETIPTKQRYSFVDQGTRRYIELS